MDDRVSVSLVYFSPTGTTERVVKNIAKGLSDAKPQILDITLPENRMDHIEVTGNIIIIGVPVYEERIPPLIKPYLRSLNYQGKYAVIVAVYGNVGAGIVLKELDEIVQVNGMNTIAAASFIGEHSFSSEKLKIAANRPNLDDQQIAREFGKAIRVKLEENQGFHKLDIPGKLPLMAKILSEGSAVLFTRPPVIDEEQCNRCGICINRCPSGAINEDLSINYNKCIRCFACVRACKRDARNIEYRMPLLVKSALKHMANKEKQPKFFL